MRLLAAAALALFALPALAASWVIEPGSTLTFTGTQAGEIFTGSFKKFTPVVEFDRAAPEKSKITVTIDMASAVIDDKDKQDSLPTEDWFFVKQFPTATFTSTRITSLSSERGAYIAEGNLTIRGVSKPVRLRFRLDEEAGKTVANGRTTLNRSDFGVGQGQWKNDKWIAYPVIVEFHLIARKGTP